MREAAKEVLSQHVEICILPPHFKLDPRPVSCHSVGYETCTENAAFTDQAMSYRNLNPFFIERSSLIVDTFGFYILLF